MGSGGSGGDGLRPFILQIRMKFLKHFLQAHQRKRIFTSLWQNLKLARKPRFKVFTSVWFVGRVEPQNLPFYLTVASTAPRIEYINLLCFTHPTFSPPSSSG